MFYRYDETTVEILKRAQQSGIDKLKEVPQFAQVVLHWCTCKHDTVLGLQFHSHRRGLGTTILDDMCLIQTDSVPLLAGYLFFHAEQQHIGAHHHIASLSTEYCLMSV